VRLVNKLEMTEEQINKIIDLALYEDAAWGDVTSQILIPSEQKGKAVIIVREEGVLAGGDITKLVFLRVDPSLGVEILIPDGKKLKSEDKIATVSGSVTSILKGERVALNFLSHLSGVASETAKYVARVKGLSIITDTRKTSPGLRVLEKYAVRMGGGQNHRLHLGDGVLIKDNHMAALRKLGMSLKDIMAKAKQNAPQKTKIEVEINTVPEALEAAQAGADIIMLDNMSPEEIKQVVALIPEQVKLEASGGITLDNAHTVAMTGVDFISVGAITHSAKALDFSLEIEPNI
jgi:nicotinate-nucleotide pyrophosphorylase (carboxylating)